MTIRKRGGRWQVDVTVNGERWRGAARTEEGAQILEAEVVASLRKGEVPEGRSPGGQARTLGGLAAAVIERVYAGTKNERHAVHNVRCAVDFFGQHCPISEIDTESVDRYSANLLSIGNSNSTVNRKLSNLSKMLRYAHRRQWITAMPHFEKQKERKGRVRYLSDEEEATLIATLEHFGQAKVARLVEFLIDTGLRRGEWLRLIWRDYDRDHSTITLWDTKNDDARTIPLTERSRRLLDNLYGSKEPQQRVFNYLPDATVRSAWNRAREHMGLLDDPDFVPHMLRHTCASRLVQRGVPILVVKEFLGHKAIQVTMRYAHLAPTNLIQARDALEIQP